MSKTAKIVIGLIVIILIIWGISASKGTKDSKPTSNEPIKIGFIGPLTGDAAIYGTTEKRAIELALEKIKQDPSFAKPGTKRFSLFSICFDFMGGIYEVNCTD
jgi:hypothetical protein